jgi:hypothetical protein
MEKEMARPKLISPLLPVAFFNCVIAIAFLRLLGLATFRPKRFSEMEDGIWRSMVK